MNKIKKINNILIGLFSIFSLCFFAKDYYYGNNDRFLADLTFSLVLFLPRIFKKLFKINFSDMLELSYLIFVILADFMGSIVNLYNMTWWYDLFTHFLSGILTTILAIMFLNYYKFNNKKNKIFNIIFMISFTLMIASIWEFTEFFTDIICKSDVQHVITTGVADTMEDMLVAFLGSVIISIIYFFDNSFLKKITVNLVK